MNGFVGGRTGAKVGGLVNGFVGGRIGARVGKPTGGGTGALALPPIGGVIVGASPLVDPARRSVNFCAS